MALFYLKQEMCHAAIFGNVTIVIAKLKKNGSLSPMHICVEVMKVVDK
jgi:hypothetical protein